MNSKAFLNKNFKFHHLYFFVIMLIIISIFLILINFNYISKYNCIGMYNDNKILVNIPLDKINTVSLSKKIEIGNKVYKIKKIDFKEINYESNIYIQVLEITSSYKSKNINELLNVNFYYDEESLMNKILGGLWK